MNYEIIPSILVDSEKKFIEQTKAVSEVVSMVQLDIADGQFVQSTTWADPEIVEEHLEIDCELHLMVADPVEELRRWEQTPQIKRVLIHYESQPDRTADILAHAHSIGWEVGVVLNIETDISVVEDFVEEIDCIQFMSVHPGKQKQDFLSEVLDKIKTFREKYPNLPIAADGHVNEETIPQLIEAGANRFGPGSAVFGNENSPADNVKKLKDLIQKLT